PQQTPGGPNQGSENVKSPSRLALRSSCLPRVPERKPRTLWACQPMAANRSSSVAPPFHGAVVNRTFLTNWVTQGRQFFGSTETSQAGARCKEENFPGRSVKGSS